MPVDARFTEIDDVKLEDTVDGDSLFKNEAAGAGWMTPPVYRTKGEEDSVVCGVTIDEVLLLNAVVFVLSEGLSLSNGLICGDTFTTGLD